MPKKKSKENEGPKKKLVRRTYGKRKSPEPSKKGSKR